MRIHGKKNVLDAARDRLRFIFHEFEEVLVWTSGGKDSTVVFNLALEIAREKNRLPLKVAWLDQEAEYQATVDAVREQMEHPDVEPYWLQFPFRLFNATSTTEHWLNCWDPAAEARWMRPKESYSIKENNFGTDRFADLFVAIPKVLWPGKRIGMLAGVRCEESPGRTMGVIGSPSYKWVTWANKKSDPSILFYPLYDWGYLDIWKAIHEHGWSYCRIYDQLYRYGVPVREMRVSNVHHETAVSCLFRIQEIEPETYHRLTARIAGIDMAAKMGAADYFPTELPPMFSSWQEFRDYLLEKLINKPDWKESFRRRFASQERQFESGPLMWRGHVTAILTNDWEGVKLGNMVKHLTKRKEKQNGSNT